MGQLWANKDYFWHIELRAFDKIGKFKSLMMTEGIRVTTRFPDSDTFRLHSLKSLEG